MTQEPKNGKEAMFDALLQTVAENVKNEVLNSSNIEQEIHEKVSKIVNDKVETMVTEQLTEVAKKLSMPRTFVLPKIKEDDYEKPEVVHHKFEEIADLVNSDMPTMLKGPAGSGKNHTVGQVARALGLKMHYINNASNEFKLTGFKSAGGEYQQTEFYKAFKDGGLFFLDEIDTSDPTALITLNSAIANGYMAFPHETIDRHDKFRIVSAGNTWGTGASSEYVGRYQLDASTLDRFYMVDFPYDKAVEKAICPDEQILEFMWALRKAVEDNKVRMIVSTRGIENFYKLSKTRLTPEQIMRGLVVKGQGKDTVDKLLGHLKKSNISNNRFFGVLDQITNTPAGKSAEPDFPNTEKDNGPEDVPF